MKRSTLYIENIISVTWSPEGQKYVEVTRDLEPGRDEESEVAIV